MIDYKASALAILMMWFWSVFKWPSLDDRSYSELKNRVKIIGHLSFFICLSTCIASPAIEKSAYYGVTKITSTLVMTGCLWISIIHIPFNDYIKLQGSNRNRKVLLAGLASTVFFIAALSQSISSISLFISCLLLHRFRNGLMHIYTLTAFNMLQMQDKIDALDAQLGLEKHFSTHAKDDNIEQAG